MRARKAWVGCAVVLLCIVGSSVVSAQEEAPPSEAQQSPPPPPPAPEPELIPTPPSTYVPPPVPPQPVNPPPRQSTLWPAPAVVPAPERAVSLTISPLHLFSPIAELTLEVAASEYIGIALVAGVGSVSVKTTDTELSATVLEVGASLRCYAVGDFSTGGLQLGAEALYFHAFLDGDVDGDSVSATGAGLGVGPMVGYKYVARSGFTFDGQLGVLWTLIRAESGSESAEVRRIRPMLNVNLGWSF